MRKFILTMVVAMIGIITIHAESYDYPYLTFETTDGTKTSVSTESIEITLTETTITAGGQTFDLSNLSKMYFSETDVTAVNEVKQAEDVFTNGEIYDLQGRRVERSQMKQGVYIVKTKNGNLKLNVQ